MEEDCLQSLELFQGKSFSSKGMFVFRFVVCRNYFSKWMNTEGKTIFERFSLNWQSCDVHRVLLVSKGVVLSFGINGTMHSQAKGTLSPHFYYIVLQLGS